MRKSTTTGHVPIEDMDFFSLYEEVSDRAWTLFESWPSRFQDTIGKQLVRATESVGANLVEGDGRFAAADSIHFFVIARASARESRPWINRCVRRKLVPTEDGKDRVEKLSRATRLLNLFRRKIARASNVKETRAPYVADPFVGEA